MFLEKHDVTPYRDVLLHACTHNLTYDSQCEDSRAPYLWKLIQLSKDPTYFRDGILRALRERGDKDDDSYRWRQIFGLARLFAAQNDAEMKQAMYSAFEYLGFDSAGSCSAEQLILLDGFEGFLHVASQLYMAIPEREGWEFDYLMRALEENLGKDQAEIIVAEKARSDQKLGDRLKGLQAHRRSFEEERGRLEKNTAPSDYSALKNQINQMPDVPRPAGLSMWGKAATPEELYIATNDLLAETDERRLAAYLNIFARRAFPANVETLLAFANDERKRVRHSAVTALSNVHHPLVRELALTLLSSALRSEDGIEMLCSNYEPGDFGLIEKALLRSDNDDLSHGMGSSIRTILERHLYPEAENSLLILYEKTPCAICRADSVRSLINLGKLPDWMQRECLYDSDEDTVKLVSTSEKAP